MNNYHKNTLSWFAVEQYNLGELDTESKREAEEHLSTCGDCSGKLSYIESDTRPLKPLLIPDSSPGWDLGKSLIWVAGLGVAATAAVLMMLIIPRQETENPMIRPAHIIHKGGTLAMSLVRYRGGEINEHPTSFVSGDRFRLRVTSPFDESVQAEVAVFQGESVFYPYPNTVTVPPGNQAGLPGSIRLTGDTRSTICVFIGDDLPGRDDMSVNVEKSLPAGTVCISLEVATDGNRMDK